MMAGSACVRNLIKERVVYPATALLNCAHAALGCNKKCIPSTIESTSAEALSEIFAHLRFDNELWS